MADRFIAVAGNIGAGKTTLTTWLTSTYDMRPAFEPFENNPYLDDFYKDMGAWGFHSQVWFLAHKYRLHLELEKTPGHIVQDRTIYEDAEIFAASLARSRNMSKRDYATYTEMYEAMKSGLQRPDLLIYLTCSVRATRRRIKQRGRESEQDIPARYLRKLNVLYAEFIDRWDHCPILVLDTEKLDYLGDLVDALEFRNRIEKYL